VIRRAALALLAAGLAGCGDEPVAPLAPQEPRLPGTPWSGPARVLVVNTLSETLSSLDPDTGTMTVQAALAGTWANRASATADRRRFLVAASGGNEVAILDAGDLSPVGTIHVGAARNPWLAREVDAGRALVSNWLASEVRVLDLQRRTAGAPVPTNPGPEGFAVAGDVAFVACTNYQGAQGSFGEGRLDVVDLGAARVRRSIAVGRNPQDVAVGPDGRVHVLCTGDYGAAGGRVDVVDPSTLAVVATVVLGGSPTRLAPGPDGAMWVVGFAGGLRRYDPATAQLAPDPEDAYLASAALSAVAADDDAGRVYVASFDDDLLVAIDAATVGVADAWLVGDGPVDVVVNRPESR
jgi:YVTN family beta-propeller protein